MTEAEPVPAAAARTRRTRLLRLVRLGLGLAAVAFLAVAVAGQWGKVRSQLGSVSVPAIGLALVLVMLGMGASMLAWRALLADLGNRLPLRAAARVLFLGQLGKYIPGSVWAVVGQTELARDYGVPRKRGIVAALAFNVLALVTSLLVALLGLPVLAGADAPGWVRWLPALLPLGLVCLVPSVLSWLCGLALRLFRREPLEEAFSWRGSLVAAGWMVVNWVLMGLHLWALGVDLGGSARGLLLPAVGGFALAWVAGYLVVVAPAGAGAREVLLVVALAAQLPGGRAGALTLAVVSRLVLTAGDVLAALLGVALASRPADRGSRAGARGRSAAGVE